METPNGTPPPAEFDAGRILACLALNPKDVISGTHKDGTAFSARADLFLIKTAWLADSTPFEPLADGFGPGLGTHGDWSGIRDSSEEAIAKMYEIAKACHLVAIFSVLDLLAAEAKAKQPVAITPKGNESWN